MFPRALVPMAVYCSALALIPAAPAWGQASGREPFTALIDDFTSGPYSYTFGAANPAAVNDQIFLDVIGGRRRSSLAAPLYPGTTGAAGSVTLNTASLGLLTVAASPNVYNNAVYILAYGSSSNAALPNTLGNLDFPGTHGVAIDFVSLSGPITVEINLGRFTGANTHAVSATWHGIITPPAAGGAFRFRTAWDQYVQQPGFTLADANYLDIGLYLPPGRTAIVSAFGIAPAPGAGAALALCGLAAVRRRR